MQVFRAFVRILKLGSLPTDANTVTVPATPTLKMVKGSTALVPKGIVPKFKVPSISGPTPLPLPVRRTVGADSPLLWRVKVSTCGPTLTGANSTVSTQFDATGKHIQTVISDDLVAPRCITEDQKNRIYVSDWGTSFQVKVFSPAGALLHVIGREGGRPWVGPWDHNGMLVPTGIALDGSGKLWVAEDDSSPKRTSVWNPDTALS